MHGYHQEPDCLFLMPNRLIEGYVYLGSMSQLDDKGLYGQSLGTLGDSLEWFHDQI